MVSLSGGLLLAVLASGVPQDSIVGWLFLGLEVVLGAGLTFAFLFTDPVYGAGFIRGSRVRPPRGRCF
jgi:hypothetical protein